jgi:hypothetical protein
MLGKANEVSDYEALEKRTRLAIAFYVIENITISGRRNSGLPSAITSDDRQVHACRLRRARLGFFRSDCHGWRSSVG